MHAALGDRELLLPRHLVVVARAAIAQHAALAIQGNVRREWDRLLEVKARAVDAAGGIPVAEREVLQRALAALVAYGTVEWVVDELELENIGPGLHRERALSFYDHAL